MELWAWYGGIFLRLLAAMFFGSLLGLERTVARKRAGLRTYALVSLGAALFVTIGDLVARLAPAASQVQFDPLRIASQVVVGIGFLGAGLIVFKDTKLSGLTTAAGLWVAAGIGLACGFELYILALMATLLTLFVFVILWFLEAKIK